ncbi:MAG TPA: hypothetical protein VLI92_02260 [Candidatus Saccharimonadales bacterium]|nr:hypothetical protein [Candidatus Saccharimonadales bacterium]
MDTNSTIRVLRTSEVAQTSTFFDDGKADVAVIERRARGNIKVSCHLYVRDQTTKELLLSDDRIQRVGSIGPISLLVWYGDFDSLKSALIERHTVDFAV